MKIAERAPFSGVPVINMPEIFGASTGKEFLYRIPVTGSRPIALSYKGDKRIKLKDGILRGMISEDTEFDIEIRAENADGNAAKTVHVVIEKDGVLKTPLLGFTTWNAFGRFVTQKDVEETADKLIESGIADYGYHYINIDSGWQGSYGGPNDAIMPNKKFPDMKAMTDYVHSKGFRCGIYSTPMLHAWGCPEEEGFYPGCTAGDPDPRYPEAMNGGIGKIHKEAGNVKQWEEWGFDYLKYDWYPTDTENMDIMKQQLLKSGREFAYCTTLRARRRDSEYLLKNVNSFRCNEDTLPEWENIKERTLDLGKWEGYTRPGHYYDLDMLTLADYARGRIMGHLTENEEGFLYTLISFFTSPIQLSTGIELLSEFELNLICNEEVIAVNQDPLSDYPHCVKRDDKSMIYSRKLANGDVAYAVFSLSDRVLTKRITIGENHGVRDLWQKKDLKVRKLLNCTLEPHEARMFVVKM